VEVVVAVLPSSVLLSGVQNDAMIRPVLTTEFTRDTLFVDGAPVHSLGHARIEIVSPATELVIGSVPSASAADVDAAVQSARRAFDTGPWAAMAVAERLEILRCAASKYRAAVDQLVPVVSAENGTPLSLATVVHSGHASATLDYFIELGATFPFEQRRSNTIVTHEPVGVVGAIVPWNFPQALLMFKLAPALVAGCSIVVKPSPETPLDALIAAEIFTEAGVPAGVINVVPAGRQAGEVLVRHPDVDKIAFTGSTAAGRRVAAMCGEDVRRCTLELGGKSAAVILEDADLDATLAGLRTASFLNSGQTCSNQTRILAPRARYEEVVAGLSDLVSSMIVGDPSAADTEVGPLAGERHRERVERYIAIGKSEGAKVSAGGGRPAGLSRGWYVEPTVFRDVDNQMQIAQEEIFGPVVAVIAYDGEEDAVRLANDSRYGLGGGVWCGDVEHGIDIARRIRTGTVRINGASSGFDAPFGGRKMSGIGRELGPEGLLAYLEPKSIPVPV
jgi:aldehyde dehydrogenase (NAD+)